MKRNSYIFISLLLSVVLFTSCITEDEYDNSPEGNFEALWQTIDRQYCFLDYKKQEYGLDWNEIYSQYKQRISKGMNNEQLFEVLADMLNELRDGHVNLSSKLEYSQYREWFDSYPANFSDSIQRVYLGKDYAQSSGMKYQVFEDNIAYIYCGSFQSGIGEGNLDEILNKLAICDGLIIDVRNNSGGNLTTAEKLAARFTNEKVLVGYMSHKTGPGHNDFSEMEYEEESQQDGYDGESIRVNTDWLYDYEEQERKRQERVQPEESSAGQDYKDESGKIVPMKKRETTGITLMKLDANHRVMARYRVNKIPFTIGRSTSNDLVLDDLCVARNHCRIIERDGRYLLEDVGTKKKLYVKGMLTGQLPQSDGLRVYIGNEEFQITVEGGRSQSTRLYKNAEGSYE